MNSINTREIKKLLFSNGVYSFTRGMFKVFISLYIWKLTSNIAAVAIFNIVFFLVHCLSFSFFAKLVKNGRTNLVKNVGLIGLILFYLFIFYLAEKSADHLIFLASFFGIFNAMYWVSYHTQNFDFTHTKNRGHYAGAENAISITSTLLAPIIGGALITFNPFGLGYGNIFILGALLQIIILMTGNIYSPTTVKYSYHPFLTLKKIWQNKIQKKLLFSEVLSDIGYSRATTDIVTIFLFIALGVELKVGSWLSFFTCFAIFSTYLISKHATYNYYKKIAVFSGIILSVSITTLALIPKFVTYIIFGSVKEITEPLIGITRRVFSLNLLHQKNEQLEHRVEYLVIREWFGVGIGASLSYLPLLFIKSFTTPNLIPILFFMALATLLESLLLNSIKTDITNL